MRIAQHSTAIVLTISLLVASFFFGVPKAEAAITFAYETTVASTTDLTTYTFSTVDIGTANADRCVIVSAIARKSGASATLSTVTIGGVSATIVVQNTNNVTNTDVAGLAAAIVPTGTTGDIVVTWSAGMLRSQIGVWTAIGTDSCTTPHDTGSSLSGDPSTTIDIADAGAAVGAGLTAAGTTASWTGLTENFDATLETFVTATGASASAMSAETGRTVTIDFAAAGVESVGVFASWAPAAGGESGDTPSGNAQFLISGGKFIID